MCVCAYVCMCVCVHVRACVCVCVCACVHMCHVNEVLEKMCIHVRYWMSGVCLSLISRPQEKRPGNFSEFKLLLLLPKSRVHHTGEVVVTHAYQSEPPVT